MHLMPWLAPRGRSRAWMSDEVYTLVDTELALRTGMARVRNYIDISIRL